MPSAHYDKVSGHDGSKTAGKFLVWRFVASKPENAVALVAGIIIETTVIIFTFWLSHQPLSCPEWASECRLTWSISWISRNFATFQGIVTASYTIGLASLGYLAHSLSEIALWPLMTEQAFSFAEMDKYLAASRGSITALPQAILAAKTGNTRLMAAVITLLSLSPLAASSIFGYAYGRVLQPVANKSLFTPGGGQGQIYSQQNPPFSVQAEALARYASWSNAGRGLTDEPMPQYRDWYIDRSLLAGRGNMTVEAVRMKKSISCHPFAVEQVANTTAPFSTSGMASHNPRSYTFNNTKNIELRHRPELAVWVDDYVFLSANRTMASLVFSALNGSIDIGTWTEITGWPGIVGTSSIKCNVDVELVDEILVVGDGGEAHPKAPSATIGSMDLIHIGYKNSTTDPSLNTLNEVILWFAVAPVLCGLPVDGKQPMFWNNTDSPGLPIAYTSTNSGPNEWTKDGIEHFIHVAIGAVAQGSSIFYREDHQPVTIQSRTFQAKMQPWRARLLLILPCLVLVYIVALTVWNERVHHCSRVPRMRLFSLAEVLKSTQTEAVQERAAVDALCPEELAAFAKAPRLKFGISPGGVVGLGDDVESF